MLAREHELASGRSELELIPVFAEVQLDAQQRSPLPSAEQQGIRSILALHVELQPSIKHLGQHPEKADEVAFPRAIRADQHVQVGELQPLQLSDRLKASNSKLS